MSVKKKIILAILAVAVVLLNIFLITHQNVYSENLKLTMKISGTGSDDIQVFYGNSTHFKPTSQTTQSLKEAGEEETLTFTVPSESIYIRIDLGSKAADYTISELTYTYGDQTEAVDLSGFLLENAAVSNDVSSASLKDGKLTVQCSGADPFITAAAGPVDIEKGIADSGSFRNLIKNCIYAGVIDLICLAAILFRKRFSTLPQELIQNRRLIFKLAKNDFKTKYAGSVLGIVWAFIQPTVTVLVYWFVFQIGLHSGNVMSPAGVEYPFVLWLMAGLVPWFFFQDTIVGGTNALMEYTYLVKKVVFKISVLPIVKEISALFVHIFFVVLTIVIFDLSSHLPDLYTLQVIYYSFALFIYSLGVCYATCSIIIFFRDLSQIISIVIQVQVWLTPIMWNIDNMEASGQIPGWLLVIFKLNPLFYIVNGYRDALINKVWFWQRFDLSFYYWIVTAVFFALGAFIFKRLKIHFADIL